MAARRRADRKLTLTMTPCGCKPIQLGLGGYTCLLHNRDYARTDLLETKMTCCEFALSLIAGLLRLHPSTDLRGLRIYWRDEMAWFSAIDGRHRRIHPAGADPVDVDAWREDVRLGTFEDELPALWLRSRPGHKR